MIHKVDVDVAAVVEDAGNLHDVVPDAEGDRCLLPITDEPQPRVYVIAPHAAVRKC